MEIDLQGAGKTGSVAVDGDLGVVGEGVSGAFVECGDRMPNVGFTVAAAEAVFHFGRAIYTNGYLVESLFRGWSGYSGMKLTLTCYRLLHGPERRSILGRCWG